MICLSDSLNDFIIHLTKLFAQSFFILVQVLVLHSLHLIGSAEYKIVPSGTACCEKLCEDALPPGAEKDSSFLTVLSLKAAWLHSEANN